MSEVIYSKKQINPLIEKFKINVENNETFNNIITLFKDQTNYQIWAIKAVFGGICPFSVIVDIKNWAENNQQEIKNLIKGNVVSYTKAQEFAQLMDEIRGLNMISVVKQTINKFNTHQRELLREAALKGVSNGIDALASKSLNKWYNLFSQVETLHKNHKDRLISTSSSLHNINELELIINNALSESYVWDKEDLLGFVSRNAKDCEVVYDKDNIVILSIPSFKSSSKICGGGRTGWCLTKQESYFNDYVKRHNDATQYFYFDFSLPERDDLAHIGFTIRQGQGITNAHSTSNGSMLGGGISYHGERVTVQQVLAKHKIDMSTFMRLRPIKNYEWSVEGLLAYVDKHKNDVSIVFENNKRFILKFNASPKTVEHFISHTFINYSNLITNSGMYAMFDMNLEVNNSNSIVGMRVDKDKYGVESPNNTYDSFNNKITNNIQFFKERGIKISDFINQTEIDPSILLHKYIDEGCENEAIELINNGKANVNQKFENKYPIHKIVENKMVNLFRCVLTNPSFDITVKDHMDEPLLLSMMYIYKAEKLSGKNNENMRKLESMINFILDIDTFNFNIKDDNFDTAVNVAAEYPFLGFALKKLVDNPNVNLNVVNDFNCTSLGNAIRRKNIDGLKLLGKRKDLVVRDEDRELAANHGIDLNKYITPEAMNNGTEGLDMCELTSELANLFAQAFNLKK